ncbi:MAG TPA: V4R domain-containing protein [Nitrospiria bacterium]|nr:V4R domain-containing protein [Nitrospiria bacterium]
MKQVLIDAAAEVVYSQLQHMAKKGEPASQRLSEFAEIFHVLGFGVLELNRITEKGGKVSAPFSHYGFGFLSKWGRQEAPACYFNSGFIEAAAAAAFDKPLGTYRCVEKECIAQGAKACQFELTTEAKARVIQKSVGQGNCNSKVSPRILTNQVDEEGIITAVSGMELVGNEEGYIPAFGVYLTRHFANYYNRISNEFEMRTQKVRGGDINSVVGSLLVEAGHVCAFNTLGGIMKSPEWYQLIYPSLKSREDWMHGIFAVMNALGWGVWRIAELIPNERLVARVFNSYESNGYLGMKYPKSDHGICYLATGATAGLANLLYTGDITVKPELSEDYYKKLFRNSHTFVAKEVKCRGKGDPFCEIVAQRR